MCTTIDVKDGPEIDTIGQAMAFFGVDALPTWGPGVTMTNPDTCLCGVDVYALAEAAGYDAEYDPFGVKFTKRGSVV